MGTLSQLILHCFVCLLSQLYFTVLCVLCFFFFNSRTQNVLGEKGRRIRELTAVVQKRFGFPEGSVEVKLPQLNQ